MNDLTTIKDRIDILALIQEYLPLKKAGVSWKACCPFHQEKTPSFIVSPERQRWHCFGCNKGGDAFSFVMDMEGISFGEALKMLADRAGVTLEQRTVSKTSNDEKERLRTILSKAAYFYHRYLLEVPAAEEARAYVFTTRGLKPETVTEWQIGYSPDQWDLLVRYLLKEGCALDDIVKAGLAVAREGADPRSLRGHYDRFRGRIMFPICDPHGAVVGFTGRILKETPESGGKYVNTPQTLLFDKSRLLYGLSKAKTTIKTDDRAILVEGQMDVLACHQYGMRGVIAASGTALTKDQLKLIKRYTTNLAMAFDADNAGEKAGERGVDAALEEGMNVRVIRIPRDVAKDADECIKKAPDVWEGAVANALPVMEWYLSLAAKRYALSNPRERHEAAMFVLGKIARIPFAVERDAWLTRTATLLTVDASILRQELRRLELSRSVSSAPRSAPLPVAVSASSASLEQTPDEKRLLRLAKAWWGIAIAFPKATVEFISKIPPKLFEGTDFHGLYEQGRARYTTGIPLDTAVFLADIEEAQLAPLELLHALPLMYAHLYPDGLSAPEAERELGKLTEELLALALKRRHREVVIAMKQAELAGDRETCERLWQEFATLSSRS